MAKFTQGVHSVEYMKYIGVIIVKLLILSIKLLENASFSGWCVDGNQQQIILK